MNDKLLTRRAAIGTLGALGAAAAVPGWAKAAEPPAPTDIDIFNFALNLESLEAEYYL